MSAPLTQRRTRFFWILLILFCWMIYSPVFSVGFYDEIDWLSLQGASLYSDKSLLEINLIDAYITQPLLRGEPIRFMFTTAFWWLINYKWWGPEVYFHHLTAFLLFLLCFSQIFIIAKKLTDSDWIAIFTTLLYALFPFNLRFIGQGYLVNYLLLSSTFLLSLSLYLTTLRSQSSYPYRVFLYSLSLIFFLLSTWSHESAYTLPILLFGLDLILSRSKGRMSLFRAILRTSPYFLLLALQIGATIYFALQLQSAEGVEHDFSGYIAYPTGTTLRFVYEGFLTPFYEGSPLRTVLSVASVCLVLSLLVLPLFTWRAQNRTALWIGLFWAALTLAPALPILGSPLNPPEAEDKYFFLPQGGFCLLLATLAMPKGRVKKPWRIAALAALCGLAVVYWIGINVNARYFLDEGRRYAMASEGLKEAVKKSPQARAICFLYGESQPDQDLMLAAFLEFSMGEEEKRAWFYLDRAMLLPQFDGRLPDLTLPKPVIDITQKTGVPGKMRGGYKNQWEFIPIQFSLDERLLLLGFDPATGALRDLRPLLLPVMLSSKPPQAIDLVRFSREGADGIGPGRTGETPAEGWLVQGNAYRLFPQSGRF